MPFDTLQQFVMGLCGNYFVVSNSNSVNRPFTNAKSQKLAYRFKDM